MANPNPNPNQAEVRLRALERALGEAAAERAAGLRLMAEVAP